MRDQQRLPSSPWASTCQSRHLIPCEPPASRSRSALGRFCRTLCGSRRATGGGNRAEMNAGACARTKAKASSSAVAQTRYILAAGLVSIDLRCSV